LYKPSIEVVKIPCLLNSLLKPSSIEIFLSASTILLFVPFVS
jgi:hypothetical protein